MWPDKKLIELGVVQDLVAGLRQCGERALTDVEPRQETKPPTPPDVIARSESRGLVGIEVTELMDREVLNINLPIAKARFDAMRAATTQEERLTAHEAHPLKVRLWTTGQIQAAICNIVSVKNALAFATDGEPYAERWVVIHTAEPFIDWAALSACVPSLPVSPTQLDYVYIIRDFDPCTRRYPYLRIHPHDTAQVPR